MQLMHSFLLQLLQLRCSLYVGGQCTCTECRWFVWVGAQGPGLWGPLGAVTVDSDCCRESWMLLLLLLTSLLFSSHARVQSHPSPSKASRSSAATRPQAAR